MAKSDKAIQNRPKNARDICDNLKYVRNGDSIKRARDFIATILDPNFVKENFQYIQPTSQRYATAGNQYDDFCCIYLISIFMAFLSEDDAEIMLMAYGFLEWFDGDLGERRKKYWEYAHKDNERLKRKRRKDKDNLLREIENGIIEYLAETLAGIINSSEQMSDFTNRVYKDFCNNRIPKKLSLPIAGYLDNSSFVKGNLAETDAAEIKVQHYRVITFKVSICGLVIYNHKTKIPIAGNTDEEDEEIFDISKEHIMAVFAGIICLTLFVSTHKTWQNLNSLNPPTIDGYTMEPSRNDTPEEGQKKQDWTSSAVPYIEVISQSSILGDEKAQAGAVKPFLHNLNLYREDTDVVDEANIASLGENQ